MVRSGHIISVYCQCQLWPFVVIHAVQEICNLDDFARILLLFLLDNVSTVLKMSYYERNLYHPSAWVKVIRIILELSRL